MKRAIVAMTSFLLVACRPSENQVDTMSLGAVDTLKAATDSAAVPPVAGATAATTAAPGGTQSKTGAASQSTTGTKAGPVDTTNIGRDRAIQINTKDPKVRLPTVDTTKRPPGGA